jgi:predicted rRNA methylase YqxC with S4 and FtsJ domains
VVPTGQKKRLDVVLHERGLAESRSQAQALVLAGLVPGHDKPGEQVPEDSRTAFCRPERRESSPSTSATASCTHGSAPTRA